MKASIGFVFMSTFLLSCGEETAQRASVPSSNPVMGTWQLVKGTLIENGDTTHTDYTENTSFIKNINDTHFAFLQHDLTKGKDSAVNASGGGNYTLSDSLYT